MAEFNADLLFEYILEREAGARGRTLFLQFRRIMRGRALLMCVALPFDMVVLCLQMLVRSWQTPKQTITLTRISPDLLTRLAENGVVYAGPPSWAPLTWGANATYMPVSAPYILVTLALYMPAGLRRLLGQWALRWVDGLYDLYKLRDARVIVHSDALPFARAFVMRAGARGMQTVCIQHGIFHANSQMKKYDGYLCDINIVRSAEDGALIASSNPKTDLCIEPDFFLTPVSGVSTQRSVPVVTLVGEGYHLADAAFSKAYTDALRRMESALVQLGCRVLFRPHPSERLIAKKFGFQELDSAALTHSMAMTDVYVGYSSTLLVEAAASGVLACQIPVNGQFNPRLDRAGIQVPQLESAASVYALALQAMRKGPASNDVPERKRRAVERVHAAIAP